MITIGIDLGTSSVKVALVGDGDRVIATASRAFTVSRPQPGFSEQDQTKLFGYFQRLSARPTGGEVSTGVGLAIVKQIVELHQGEIRLEATSPQGSTFLVRLPRSLTDCAR